MASHASCKLIDNKFVIWILSETKFFAVVEHLAKALWVVFRQSFDSDLHLLLLDVSVFFSLWPSWKALPWKLTLQEVEKYMANRFEAVSSGLLVTNVSVQGGVSSCSCEIFTVFERYVLSVAGLVALCQTKINNVDGVFGSFRSSSHEIIRLDVSVDDSFFVNYLNSLEHLNCNMEHSREVKLSPALLE